MSDRVSEVMPDTVSELMPDRMSESVSYRMSESMSDRRSGFLSDRISEFMPDTVSENVMVGIPRSEDLFFQFVKICHLSTLLILLAHVLFPSHSRWPDCDKR